MALNADLTLFDFIRVYQAPNADLTLFDFIRVYQAPNADLTIFDYVTNVDANPGLRKVWNGSAWIRVPEYVWNGSAWVTVV